MEGEAESIPKASVESTVMNGRVGSSGPVKDVQTLAPNKASVPHWIYPRVTNVSRRTDGVYQGSKNVLWCPTFSSTSFLSSNEIHSTASIVTIVCHICNRQGSDSLLAKLMARRLGAKEFADCPFHTFNFGDFSQEMEGMK